MKNNRLTCLTIMPEGLNNGYGGGPDESNYIYSEIITRGINFASDSLGNAIKNIRLADKSKAGAITATLIRNLANSDIVIADITGANSNIYLMLGIRYALRKKITILLGQTGTLIPFDIRAYQ